MTSGSTDDVARGPAHGLAPGTRLRERYEVGRVLGRGGMSVVYEALDRVRGARVALKTMRGLDAAALHRFRGEFRSLARVSHPNLVSLYDLESDGEATYFTMEYVEGVDFFEHVSRAPRDAARLRSALLQLVEGISVLHGRGKLHRDLKPSNVLVTSEGRVVVLDFGLVSSFGRETLESAEHDIVGTPEYMSPEQASGAELTEASDWYSVGVMLYEAITGGLPFTGPPMKVLLDKQKTEPPPPRGVEGEAELDTLCTELLRRDPARRPTARRLRERLGGAPSSQPAPAPLTMPTMGAPFVGREEPMRRLAESFASARDGRLVVACVHGGSGMGKSLLVRRWLDTLAGQDDVVVFTGRYQARESVPHRALDDVMDAVCRHLRRLPRDEVDALLPPETGALARIFPALGRVEAVSAALPPADESPDPLELRQRAASALRELFHRMASRRPVVLWVDDLQWGDPDSAILIEAIVRPPEPPPMLLVVSYRTEDASARLVVALREALARDGRGSDVREIEVRALEPSDARRLALALLGEDDPNAPAHASTLAAESRGDPLFVNELVRHVSAGKALDPPSSVPALVFDDVLRARVSALSPNARRLLEIIAVAGGAIPRSAAASAAELEGEPEVTALAQLRVGRLVRSRRSRELHEVECFHDRIREAVVASIDAASLSRLHIRVGLALQAREDVAPEVLVPHFRAGGNLPRAAELAAAAAEMATHGLAFDRAAVLWGIALELPEISPERRRELKWNLGNALASAGRGAEAAEAYLGAAEGASARDGLELRRTAAEQLLRSGRIGEGVRAVGGALAAVGITLPTSSWLPLVALLFYEAVLRVRGVRFRARDATELSAKSLTQVDVLWSVGASLAIVRPILARLFQAKHLLLALRAGESTRVARALSTHAATSALAGAHAHRRTEELLDAARALAGRLHDPYCSARIVLAEGVSAHLEGRFHHAAERCDLAAQQFRERCKGTNWEITNAVLLGSQALFQIGEMAELSKRIATRAQEARERGDLYLLTNLRISWMNAVWLAADDVERAEREVDEAMAQWGSPEQHLQQYYELIARVQIELYRGSGRRVLRLLEDRWNAFRRAHLMRIQLVRVGLFHHRARGAVATIAAGEVSGAAAKSVAAGALRDVRKMLGERLRWATPLATLVEGAVHALRGDKERAIALLADAARDFDAIHMKLWSAAATRRRGELSGGDLGRSLTDDADARMRAEGVKDPAKYCAMLAPGYSTLAHGPRREGTGEG